MDPNFAIPPELNIETMEISDFIGVFDTDFDTGPLMEYYNHSLQAGVTVTRRGVPQATLDGQIQHTAPAIMNTRTDNGTSTDFFDQMQLAMDPESGFQLPYNQYNRYVSGYNQAFNRCFEHYAKEYEALVEMPLAHTFFNIQRTLPKQGYHIWHCENAGPTCTRRVLATMMYLNDDFEGGETEFLYQSRRVEAKTGRLVIWPAHFTHLHRGNPPLSGEKYIATGWIEFMYS